MRHIGASPFFLIHATRFGWAKAGLRPVAAAGQRSLGNATAPFSPALQRLFSHTKHP